MPLAGRPMVEWSLLAMRSAPSVGPIVVAAPPGHDLGDADLRVVEGGETRSESVSNALEEVDSELVAIHDAARPLVTPDLIEEVIATLIGDPDAAGAIAATPVTDTLKQVADSAAGAGPAGRVADKPHPGVVNGPLVVEQTLDRGRLWAAQTPQVFRVEALRAALEADPEGAAAATDEATLVEAAGGRVLIRPAPAENLKVTTPLDLKLAEQLLK